VHLRPEVPLCSVPHCLHTILSHGTRKTDHLSPHRTWVNAMLDMNFEALPVISCSPLCTQTHLSAADTTGNYPQFIKWALFPPTSRSWFTLLTRPAAIFLLTLQFNGFSMTPIHEGSDLVWGSNPEAPPEPSLVHTAVKRMRHFNWINACLHYLIEISKICWLSGKAVYLL
jgi:hypothetical protein